MTTETKRIFGRDFPVMKRLSIEWFLVAHQNGPAIAKTFDAEGVSGLLSVLHSTNDEIPEAIKRDAIEAYVDLSWGMVKPDYWPVTK